MPIATRTYPPDIAATITQATLFAGIRDALSAVFGVLPLKSYAVGTEQHAIWRIIGDATKAFGSGFYRLRVTAALAVSHVIAAGFTDATNALVSASGENHTVTYVANLPVRMLGFATDEYKFLSVIQGTVPQLLGCFRPGDALAYDENAHTKFFIAANADATSVASPTNTPYTSALTTNLGNPNMANVDAALQLRSQFLGFWIWGPNNSGIVASTSIDLASGCCVGLARTDTFNVPGTNPPEQYFVHRAVAGGLMFRIAGAP